MHSLLPILLCDENEPRRRTLSAQLRANGRIVLDASDTRAGLLALDDGPHDALVLGLPLVDRDLIDVISRARRRHPDMPVIVIACPASADQIAAAVNAGAQHCLVHPVPDGSIERAIAALRPPRGNRARGSAAAADDRPVEGFDGTSAPMRAVYARIAAAARSRAPVFISGESGTGKKLCARAIHNRSARPPVPFLSVDCRGLSERGLEVAIDDHMRKLSRSGGTLFLDDVSALCSTAQLTLTRILNGFEARAHGPDLRVICTAVTPPPRAARTAPLHLDLLHRLQVLPVTMPPLRDRRADIAALCATGLHRFATEAGRRPPRLSDCASRFFESHPWPGNVRQLLNVLLALTMLHDSPLLTKEMLPEEVLFPHTPAPFSATDDLAGLAGQPMSRIERAVLEDAIARHGGSVPRAARELEIAPSTIYRKIAAWNSEA